MSNSQQRIISKLLAAASLSPQNTKVAAEIEMAIRTKAGVITKKIEGNPIEKDQDTEKENNKKD